MTVLLKVSKTQQYYYYIDTYKNNSIKKGI